VLSLQGMSYPNKTIGIIVTCPLEYGENFFEEGKIYQVLFADQNQADFGWVIGKEELLAKNGLQFWPYAISVKKMP
jgi:hypothetical protein